MTTSQHEPSDAELVRRAAAGDRDAFAAIYHRYHAVVYRFARTMSGSTALAEDATQEVFLVLMRDLARYEPQRAGLATYLYGIARNVTRAGIRRERIFVELDVTFDRPELSTSGDPAAALSEAQHVTRLRRIISALPSRYREVLILCELHGLSYAEAAAALSTPVGTVRSRLHRARQMVTERLRDPERRPRIDGSTVGCLA